jgi:Tfp pilus assembly protein PilE
VAGLWISLAVLLVAVAAGIAVAAYRGVCLYRRAKRSTQAFAAPIARIEETTAAIERRLAEAQESADRLSTAAERLRLSRARLDVQLDAVRDARARLRRTLWFVPGL